MFRLLLRKVGVLSRPDVAGVGRGGNRSRARPPRGVASRCARGRRPGRSPPRAGSRRGRPAPRAPRSGPPSHPGAPQPRRSPPLDLDPPGPLLGAQDQDRLPRVVTSGRVGRFFHQPDDGDHVAPEGAEAQDARGAEREPDQTPGLDDLGDCLQADRVGARADPVQAPRSARAGRCSSRSCPSWLAGRNWFTPPTGIPRRPPSPVQAFGQGVEALSRVARWSGRGGLRRGGGPRPEPGPRLQTGRCGVGIAGPIIKRFRAGRFLRAAQPLDLFIDQPVQLRAKLGDGP